MPKKPETRDLLNGPNVHVDDLLPLTNPMQQMDLVRMLFYTPTARKPAVALAFIDLSFTDWCAEAGLPRVYVYDWIAERRTMPLGAARRLAKVLGLTVDELFGSS